MTSFIPLPFPITVKRKMITDHVYKIFPNNVKDIQALLQKDASFREACADYEEICTWLACYSGPGGRPSHECDRAREVMRDLEDEIKKVLRGAGF